MFQVVSEILKNQVAPLDVASAISWRQIFAVFDGSLSAEEVQALLMAQDGGGRVPKAKRFFSKEGQLFHHGGKTYVLSNQWGDRTLEAIELLVEKFPALNIDVAKTEEQ
jgi:hypothetical protein